MAAFKGQTIKISYEGAISGLSKIYGGDKIARHDSLSKEKNAHNSILPLKGD